MTGLQAAAGIPVAGLAVLTTLASAMAATPKWTRRACEVLSLASTVAMFVLLPWQWALAITVAMAAILAVLVGLDRIDVAFQSEWSRYVDADRAGEAIPARPPRSQMVAWALSHNRDAAEVLASVALTAMAASCESCGGATATEQVVFGDGEAFTVCRFCAPNMHRPTGRAS